MSKRLFDTVRRMLKRGLTQAEVDAINAALQGSDVKPDVPTQPEGATVPKAISKRGIELIKKYEGCHKVDSDGDVHAYLCPAGVWTIGYGSTGYDGFNHRPIGKNTLWTQEQCDKRLAMDLRTYAAAVVNALKGEEKGTSQAQFDALVSFHYNTGAIARATLTKRHKAGDFEGAAREFAKWNKANGKVLRGLVRRRGEEANLYMSGSA